MSYRNSERKTQEMMHATIALAVARRLHVDKSFVLYTLERVVAALQLQDV